MATSIVYVALSHSDNSSLIFTDNILVFVRQISQATSLQFFLSIEDKIIAKHFRMMKLSYWITKKIYLNVFFLNNFCLLWGLNNKISPGNTWQGSVVGPGIHVWINPDLLQSDKWSSVAGVKRNISISIFFALFCTQYVSQYVLIVFPIICLPSITSKKVYFAL